MALDPTHPTVPAPATGRITSSSFAPGDLFAGRYAVRAFIARGGMGAVFEVEDTQLHEVVALKTLDAELASSEQARARFQGEVKAARLVSHVNVCRMFDFGVHLQHDGLAVPFLTMELLPGRTLAERLDAGRVQLEEAEPIIRQVAAGLDAVHAAGLVHRDLKPGNVMLTEAPDGRLRAVVMDFGIARRMDQATLTRDGWVGTPAYVAPEQLRGQPVLPATDVYALGVMMFQLVTGRLPFEGTSEIEIAMQRLGRTAPPARSVDPSVPARWNEVIARCLERDPKDRFRSPAEVVAALGPGRLPMAPRRRRMLTVATLLGLSVLVPLGAVVARKLVGPPGALPVASVPFAACSVPGAEQRFRLAVAQIAAGRDQQGVQALLELDGDAPRCGSAALQLAVAAVQGRVGEEARAYFRRALDLKPTLGQRDRALVDALVPAFSDPPRWPEAVERMQAFLVAYPGDAQGFQVLGALLETVGQPEASAAAYRKELEIDPDSAMAYTMLAGNLRVTDEPAAIELLHTCIERLPEGLLCRRTLASFHRLAGRCTELEALGREVTALAPDAPDGYEARAIAAIAAKEDERVVRELLSAARARMPEHERGPMSAWDGFQSAMRVGDFAAALAALDGESGGPAGHLFGAAAVERRVQVLFEMGEKEQAADVAEAYLEEAALRDRPARVQEDLTASMNSYRLAAGRITKGEHARVRDAWIASWKDSLGPGYEDAAGAVWGLAFRPPDVLMDAADAAEAFARMPEEVRPTPGRDATVDRHRAPILLAAGRVDDALRLLERSARRCTMSPDVELLLLLGDARMMTGDRPGACQAWAEVVRRWGNAVPRSITAERARERLGTCPAGP